MVPCHFFLDFILPLVLIIVYFEFCTLCSAINQNVVKCCTVSNLPLIIKMHLLIQ
jgi:hypothetical protein